MVLKHGPAPWRRDEHKGIGLKIVDAKGDPVAFLHYPQSLEQHANLRLLLRSPEVFQRLKGLAMLVRAGQLFKGAAEKLIPLVEAERLVAEIETVATPPKPPEKERL